MRARAGVAVLFLVLAARPCVAEAVAQAVDRALAGWPLADVALQTASGRAFTREDLTGRWTFLLLRPGPCDAPCDAALSALSGLHRRIAGTVAVHTTQVIVVSTKPGAVSPDLRQRVAAYDERFIALGGTPDALEDLARDLAVNAPGAALRGSLWLIGPDAVIRAELLPPYDVAALTATYLRTRMRR
jgi:protein SCO1/2